MQPGCPGPRAAGSRAEPGAPNRGRVGDPRDGGDRPAGPPGSEGDPRESGSGGAPRQPLGNTHRKRTQAPAGSSPKRNLDLTNKALLGSLRVALSTVGNSRGWQSSILTNKIGAMAAGGAGGFFGIAGLAVELPVSTTIMMRAIATIAREHGEDTSTPESRIACLEVFALGGPSKSDDATETGYYLVRGAMAKAVAEAVSYLGKGGAAIAGRERRHSYGSSCR